MCVVRFEGFGFVQVVAMLLFVNQFRLLSSLITFVFPFISFFPPEALLSPVLGRLSEAVIGIGFETRPPFICSSPSHGYSSSFRS